MKRIEFIKTCGMGCLGVMAGSLILSSCAATTRIKASINGSFLELDSQSFENDGGFRKYIIVENEQLQYPISVFRMDEFNYKALYMRCTHQGTELQVFGDRLQCPAHGSEFTNNGTVQNGPADKDLRSFPVIVENNVIKIDLS
ncbi:Rieske 2Fe-2S domain-containing protein [Ekhidna sp.]|uniref:Rieske (2Fe-2S) protein n=1 Tax=Ekhidna sp. TaxID=2608089 RepID=UPI0032EB63CB